MIFVTCGTFGFDPLVQKVDELIQDGTISEEVVAQIGSGSYEPKNCEFFRMKPSINDYYKNSRIVISHGGISIIEAISVGARVIAAANPLIADNHQVQLLRHLNNGKYLLWCRDIDQLPSLLASQEQLHSYGSTTKDFANEINHYIFGP